MGVDLHTGTFDPGHLADLDVLMEERAGLLNGLLDGAGLGWSGIDLLGVGGISLGHVVDDLLAELDELRGLGHEVGLGVELDGIADLALSALDDGGGDQALLSLAALAGACGLDAGGADDLLGAGHVALGLGQGLLDVHHAGAGLITQLLDQCSGDFCHKTLLSRCQVQAA